MTITQPRKLYSASLLRPPSESICDSFCLSERQWSEEKVSLWEALISIIPSTSQDESDTQLGSPLSGVWRGSLTQERFSAGYGLTDHRGVLGGRRSTVPAEDREEGKEEMRQQSEEGRIWKLLNNPVREHFFLCSRKKAKPYKVTFLYCLNRVSGKACKRL